MMDKGTGDPASKKLWAPWRQKVMSGPKPKGCIFCTKPRSKSDRANYVLKRSKLTFTMLNLYPYNNGHLLVSPYRHVDDLSLLTAAEANELMAETGAAAALLKKRLKPHGFNIGMNIGQSSGGSFTGHLHMHVVPRWSGDTNFMPVAAGVKVISHSLDALYRRLSA